MSFTAPAILSSYDGPWRSSKGITKMELSEHNVVLFLTPLKDLRSSSRRCLTGIFCRPLLRWLGGSKVLESVAIENEKTQCTGGNLLQLAYPVIMTSGWNASDQCLRARV